MNDLARIELIMDLLDEAYLHYAEHGDGHHKSSEGAVSVYYGNTFDRIDADPSMVMQIRGVEVYSYLFGPSRNHSFDSAAAALHAVREWHAAEMLDDHSGDGL